MVTLSALQRSDGTEAGAGQGPMAARVPVTEVWGLAGHRAKAVVGGQLGGVEGGTRAEGLGSWGGRQQVPQAERRKTTGTERLGPREARARDQVWGRALRAPHPAMVPAVLRGLW